MDRDRHESRPFLAEQVPRKCPQRRHNHNRAPAACPLMDFVRLHEPERMGMLASGYISGELSSCHQVIAALTAPLARPRHPSSLSQRPRAIWCCRKAAATTEKCG